MNDMERTRRFLASPLLRRYLPVLIVLLYAAGMGVMIFGCFDLGVSLWVVSTVLGALLLYARRAQEKKLRDLEREAAEAGGGEEEG